MLLSCGWSLVSSKQVSPQLPAVGVTLPLWVPYQAGLMLALTHSQVRPPLTHGHTYTFLASTQSGIEVDPTAALAQRGSLHLAI